MQDVIDDTSGHFESILLSLLKVGEQKITTSIFNVRVAKTERDTSTTVDTQLAKKEGDDLYRVRNKEGILNYVKSYLFRLGLRIGAQMKVFSTKSLQLEALLSSRQPFRLMMT